jgi:hypothetical protein
MTQTDRDTPVTALLREALEDAITLLSSGYVKASMPPGEPDETIAALRAFLASSDDVAGSGERLQDVLRDVLEAGHGPMLGSGATYRRCACVLHEQAFAIVDAAPTTEAPPKDALEDERRIEMAKALAPILRQAEDDIATLHPRGTPLSHAPLFLADRLAAAGVWAVTTLREDAPTTEAPPKDRRSGVQHTYRDGRRSMDQERHR